MSNRVTLERLRRGMEAPALFGRELNRLYHTRFGRRPYNTDGIDVFGTDWDTLAIADACRYDAFAARSDLPGELSHRISRGSNTTEFLKANVAGKDLRDTVYVTGNMQYENHREELDVKFCDVNSVWKSDGWDDEFRTVRPDTITRAALDMAERYPDKRLLVHYVQPHYPFIGPTGRQYFDADSRGFWHTVMDGSFEVSDHVIRRAYAENVNALFPALHDLLDARSGRTIVTADHGEFLGDRSFPVPIKEYGHSRGTYVEELVRVPWLVHESGERPQITAAESDADDTYEEVDEHELTERLEALGYTE